MAAHGFMWERLALEQHIGTGGMADVYRATDRETGERVAVKLLHPRSDEDDAARFIREAETLSDLRHPRIVTHIAHGLTPEGAPWLAMEWLDGEDLAVRLRRGRLSAADSLEIALAIADALGFAHARGVVHRDLKPSNVFLVGGNPKETKILDFGVARLVDRTRMTRTGMLIGTLGYMAPEQIRGQADVGPPADVYSLGCVLFECLTGERAVVAEHPVAYMAKAIFDDVPRLRERSPSMPEALDALLARMLDKDARSRPRDGGAVAEALRAFEGQLSQDIEPQGAPPRATPSLTGDEQRSAALIMVGAGEPGDKRENSELRRVAEHHGGRAEELMDGSVVVMLSSASLAHDLAAQAARCALSLRALTGTRPISLVIVRHDSSTRGRLPLGQVVDRAADLLSSTGARARSPVCLDAVVAGLLDARFDVREEEGAFGLWHERELSESTRLLLGKATPCVGRERELRQIEMLFDACVEERAAQTVLVTAPAGVGKSRLGQEFLRKVRGRSEPVSVWMGRGDSLRAGSPLGMLGQVLRGACGVREGEPLEARRVKIREGVAERVAEPERARVAAFLGELVSTPFPDDETPLLGPARRDAPLMGDQTRAAFLDFTAGECAHRPLLIILEDLHWGDKATVQFFDAMQRAMEEAPLFILALARPEVHEAFPKLWSGSRVQAIQLSQLSKRAIERLATHVLGSAASLDTLERLGRLSEGNAFYLEELLRFTAEGRSEGLPETALSMVESRIGALDVATRRLIRAASVFGEVCWKASPLLTRKAALASGI